MKVWVDGRIFSDPTAPMVSAFDHGVLVGRRRV